MLLAICTIQVKKRVEKKEKKNKVTKNLLQGDSNPDPPNYKIVRAFRLVKNLWFIVPLNSKKT